MAKLVLPAGSACLFCSRAFKDGDDVVGTLGGQEMLMHRQCMEEIAVSVGGTLIIIPISRPKAKA